ncbi:MAG: PRC-barrel domain-containing protein [Hyphomicrobiaceae bacterium]|nr:PRC-barrel domain-containing protein [Hyphomicrobiaceae bacterium]
MKKFLIGLSSAALLAASPAIAETKNPDAPGVKTPTQTAPMPRVDETRAGEKAKMPDGTHKADYRASKILGASVVNSKNETIGDINDLIVMNDGKVGEVIVGVGGFLGLGERNVALKLSELDMRRNESGNIVIATNMTKEQLKQLPEWKTAAVN